MGQEWGPVSLVSTIEELLGRNSSGSGLENREYGRGDSLRWSRDTIYRQKLAPISPTSGGRLVGIVRSRIKDTEFVCFSCLSTNVSTISRQSYFSGTVSFYGENMGMDRRYITLMRSFYPLYARN
jgi:hypothetical protein